MSGLNHNQNHSNNGRILSRVLQPPGGASSFSLGGYGGGASDFVGSRKGAGSYKPPAAQAPAGRDRRDSLDDLVSCGIPGLQGHYQDKQKYGSGSTSQHENMLYASTAQNQSVGRGGNGAGTLSSNDYASQLRAQIAMNDSIRKSDGEYANPYSRSNRMGSSEGKENSWGGADSRSGSRSSYESEYSSQSQKRSSYATAAGAEYQNAAHTSTRIRAPPGGQSSFSIGWN